MGGVVSLLDFSFETALLNKGGELGTGDGGLELSKLLIFWLGLWIITGDRPLLTLKRYDDVNFTASGS